ncbi:COBW domain-containing protein 1 (Cobalamin synthase W domain-containing protein 1) [Durusdinium trenchii]|uniref:COBW domain-containing protein 1 (Cobalamin synthase W domain-containing protein 1) n=1 Tax=Durusdinium trenchii TaxID=1381693 RepID=A0ABP0R8X7_9DINO
MQGSQHFADGETFGVYGEIITAQAARPEKAEEDKIPVTILTGFLGAGKTTLLNYILQEQKEKKIAIIENEFGEVSIDDSLLKQEKLALAEKIVVMDNGCMCCTIRGDLLGGLQEIIDAIKGGSGIDQVMIETTGMADPVPIVRTFMSSPEVTQDLRLDAVVTVADSKNLPKRLDDTVEEGKVNEAFQQVAFADKIILNKLDLVSSEEAIAIKDRIRSINTFAKIIPAVKGKVKMSELCNIRAHDICNFVNEDIDKDAEAPHDMTSIFGDGTRCRGHVDVCHTLRPPYPWGTTDILQEH